MLFTSLLLLWGGASLIQPPTQTVELAVIAMDCALILHFCSSDRRAILPLLAWRKWVSGAWKTTILVAVVLFPLLAAYFWFAEHLGFPIQSSQEQQPHLSMWLIVVLSCVVAPIFEELCFRGYILGKLTRALGPTDALVIQAALFSVLHLAPVIFVSHFLMGLAFGYLARATKSLYPPMALHAAWNSLVILSEL
jgi:membrane protease YdiL (CAAX protease family)